MSHLNEIPPTVLASLLESVQDNEGVLVCRDELKEWGDEAVCRAFAIYQFNAFRGGDDGLTFSHEESGTSLSYNGMSVTLAHGGNITEAMPDLLRTLHDLGWRNIDVYSAHGDELHYDLARYIPAHLELEVRACDIPANMNDDLRAFSDLVESRQNGGPSAEEQFMNILRGEVDMPPLADVKATVPSAVEEARPGMGVSLNYVPDLEAGDPMDMEPQVPNLGGGHPASPPSPAPRAFVGTERPVFELSTGSPVVSVSDAPAPSPAPLPVDLPAPASSISSPEIVTVEDESPMMAVIAKAAVPSATPTPAAKEKRTEWKEQSHRQTPVLDLNLSVDTDQIGLGDAIVVLDAPWHPLPSDCLAKLQRDGGRQREVVRVALGAGIQFAQHVTWSPLSDFNSIADDNWPMLHGMVSALFPNNADFLPVLALLLLLKAEHTQGMPPQLGDLFGLSVFDSNALVERMESVGDSYAALQAILPVLNPPRQRQALDAALWRLAESVGPLVVIDTMGANGRDDSPPLSFVDVARGGDLRIFVITLDAMDLDGPAEWLAKGLMRWVGRLAQTQWLGAKESKSAAEVAASKALEQMAPEMRAAFEKLLSQK